MDRIIIIKSIRSIEAIRPSPHHGIPSVIISIRRNYVRLIVATSEPFRQTISRVMTKYHASSVFHFSIVSLLLSGASRFIAPPSTFDVASAVSIKGLTKAGGIWRNTPPTAPVIPFLSCSSVATRTMFEAV